jgi:hypothetical protein
MEKVALKKQTFPKNYPRKSSELEWSWEESRLTPYWNIIKADFVFFSRKPPFEPELWPYLM